MKRNHATLPLHTGKAPAWLFQRMRKMAGSVTEIMVMELGSDGFLQRVSDPFWFQCLGCVLGFDWHSSGVTTTTCAAIKEGIEGRESELGLFVCGGKGAASRKTPQQIMDFSSRAGTDGDKLVYASRMSAKVDSSALQDGFQVYHHCFFFTAAGKWSVVQQGMNEESGWARRYHWLDDGSFNFVCEPHKAVCSDGSPDVFNMVALEAEASRKASAEVSRLPPDSLIRELKKIFADKPAKNTEPDLFSRFQEPALALPARHGILAEDIDPKRLKNTFVRTYEKQPADFERLLGIEGVGPKTIRALSLIGQLLHGAEPSFRDPARFSFAHGGKDGIPFPVDRTTYDTTAAILEKAVSQAKVGDKDKLHALRRMAEFLEK